MPNWLVFSTLLINRTTFKGNISRFQPYDEQIDYCYGAAATGCRKCETSHWLRELK
jgi:hypothetical protein